MNRASVFELHKRFKEGRESVRDDEMPEAMNDREKWRESVRDIRASGTT